MLTREIHTLLNVSQTFKIGQPQNNFKVWTIFRPITLTFVYHMDDGMLERWYQVLQ